MNLLAGTVASGARMSSADLDAVLMQAKQQIEENCLAWVRRVDLKEEQITASMILPGAIPLELTRMVRMVLKKRGVERRIVIQGMAQSWAK